MTLSAPTDSSTLHLMEIPARLRIPLGTRAPMDLPSGIEIGKTVAKGQPLADAPVEGGPAALAPTSGRIVAVTQVTLTNGQTVPAVEVESDFQDRAVAEDNETPPGPASWDADSLA